MLDKKFDTKKQKVLWPLYVEERDNVMIHKPLFVCEPGAVKKVEKEGYSS